MAKPIQLSPHTVRVEAPRELIFQKLSSFGRGRLKGGGQENSRLLCSDGDTMVVEFKTKAGLLSYTTIELVTVEPPDRIVFEHLSGPMQYARDEFLFREVESGTELTHRGEFIWTGIPLIGWFGGRFFTKPMFEHAVERHMSMIKETCEARSARSHVFRQ